MLAIRIASKHHTCTPFELEKKVEPALTALRTGSWPKNFDISRIVYRITIRLAGRKALGESRQLPDT